MNGKILAGLALLGVLGTSAILAGCRSQATPCPTRGNVAVEREVVVYQPPAPPPAFEEREAIWRPLPPPPPPPVAIDPPIICYPPPEPGPVIHETVVIVQPSEPMVIERERVVFVNPPPMPLPAPVIIQNRTNVINVIRPPTILRDRNDDHGGDIRDGRNTWDKRDDAAHEREKPEPKARELPAPRQLPPPPAPRVREVPAPQQLPPPPPPRVRDEVRDNREPEPPRPTVVPERGRTDPAKTIRPPDSGAVRQPEPRKPVEPPSLPALKKPETPAQPAPAGRLGGDVRTDRNAVSGPKGPAPRAAAPADDDDDVAAKGSKARDNPGSRSKK